MQLCCNVIIYLFYQCYNDNIHLANAQTSVLFLIGLESNGSNETRNQINNENHIYGDLIQVDGLFEHYDNLTLKTLYTMKFFLQEGKK